MSADSEPVYDSLKKFKESLYIPPIQREIVWDKQKCLDLLDNLLYIPYMDNSNEKYIHCFESIFVRESELVGGKKVTTVYDGLQRLAFITTFIAIMHYLYDSKSYDIKKISIIWSSELQDMGTIYDYISKGIWQKVEKGNYLMESQTLSKDLKKTNYYKNFEAMLKYIRNLNDTELKTLDENFRLNFHWYVDNLNRRMDPYQVFVYVNSKGTIMLVYEMLKSIYVEKDGRTTRYTNIIKNFEADKDTGHSINHFINVAGKVYYEFMNDCQTKRKFLEKQWDGVELYNKHDHNIPSIEEFTTLSEIWLNTFDRDPRFSILKSKCLSSEYMKIMFKVAYSKNKHKKEIINFLYDFALIVACLKTKESKLKKDSLIGSNDGKSKLINNLLPLVEKDNVNNSTLNEFKIVISNYVNYIEEGNSNFFEERLKEVLIDKEPIKKPSDRNTYKLLLYRLDEYKYPDYKGRRQFSASDIDGDHVLSKNEAKELKISEKAVNSFGNLALLCKSANRSKGCTNVIVKAGSIDYRNSGFETTSELSNYIASLKHWNESDIINFAEKRANEAVEFMNTIIRNNE